ncbi:membrane protein [Gordonia phage LittleFella]|nr:membrane protein [Gordonia phage LittleFella]
MNRLRSVVWSAWSNLTHDSHRSVGFPLYRILALFIVPPGVLQLVFQRVPDSIRESTPEWYDIIFILFQLFGALAIVVSLAMGDSQDSAKLERIAAWVLGGTGCIYFFAVWVSAWPTPPMATATWMQLGFSVFCFIRIKQINKRLKRFHKRVAETLGEE